MPGIKHRLGKGSTLVFMTSGWTAEAETYSTSDATREMFNVTPQNDDREEVPGQIGNQVMLASEDVENLTYTVEVNLDPGNLPPLHAAPEPMEFRFKARGKEQQGAFFSFVGAVSGLSMNLERGPNKATVTIQDMGGTLPVDGKDDVS